MKKICLKRISKIYNINLEKFISISEDGDLNELLMIVDITVVMQTQ